MSIIDVLLAELEQEAPATERVLARVPQAHLSWRPHPKSFSLGQLALHVATNPGNVAQLVAMDLVTSPPTGVQAEAATAAELVPTLKASIAVAIGLWTDGRRESVRAMTRRRHPFRHHRLHRVRGLERSRCRARRQQ